MNTAFNDERALTFLRWMHKNTYFLRLQDNGITYKIACDFSWSFNEWLRFLVPKPVREQDSAQKTWDYLYDRIFSIKHNGDMCWPQAYGEYAGLNLEQYVEKQLQRIEGERNNA